MKMSPDVVRSIARSAAVVSLCLLIAQRSAAHSEVRGWLSDLRDGGTAPTPLAPVVTTASDTLVIVSKVLGQRREAYIALPASWASTTRPYPVLIVLDGETSFIPLSTVQTTLARLGHVPEAIVVAIPNVSYDPRERVHDMTPPGLSVSGSSMNEGGDDFLDFIERELLPEVDRRWRGGKPRTLVGHSSGGVIATWAAATRPERFPVIVAMDAPIHLQENWLAHRLIDRARRGGPTSLRYVSLETRFGWPDESWSKLKAAAPSAWRLHREKLPGESHESMFFLGAYQGLKFAFSDYSIVGAPFFPEGTTIGVFEHFARIEREFGVSLPPSRRVLVRLVDDLLIEGRVEPARRALTWLVDGYGEQAPEVSELRAHVDDIAARPALTETVEHLKATPYPTPEEIKPYLGHWVGETFDGPAPREPFELYLSVEDGRVQALMLFPTAPEPFRQRRPEYLKILPDGIEFGSMNGMRPAGMLVYKGTRKGDVLAGVHGFRGIMLPLPGGRMPPVTKFRLTHQQPTKDDRTG